MRKQCVSIENVFSCEREVRRGVPQSSVLGPVLSNICFGNFNGQLTAFTDYTAFLYVSKNLIAMHTAVELSLIHI